MNVVQLILLVLTLLATAYCLVGSVIATYIRGKNPRVTVTASWYVFALPVVLAVVTAVVHYVR